MVPNFIRIFIPAMLIASMFRLALIAVVRLVDAL
jgi:hypothetical protein